MGISKIYYIESDSFDPYYNLALEEKLLDICKEEDLIFYLWQNDNTVVIGKNQSAYKECNIDLMEKDGVKLSRRISGGGAVYHDLGNLNFTFVMHRNNYDLNRQLTVIKEALNKHGAYAYFSGRNDILIGEKKISGNAFYLTDKACYHHGTILINSDLEKLSKYLQVSKSKLKANGVNSIKSRVDNVSTFVKDITIETVKNDLKEMVSKIYWLPIEEISIEDVNRDKYIDKNWLFRKEVESNYSLSNKFSWGEILMKFMIVDNSIENINVFSDSMDINISEQIEEAMVNQRFNFSLLDKFNMFEEPYKSDLKNYFKEVFNG
ncbi:MAG TPA: lipoate--protein ligase [Erysipelotrichaceae bacterium]|nr:lipoate--protein ligase [Erysipelotrichaceae bacterium]